MGKPLSKVVRKKPLDVTKAEWPYFHQPRSQGPLSSPSREEERGPGYEVVFSHVKIIVILHVPITIFLSGEYLYITLQFI